MNINWKKSISVLAVSCTLFFVGCGGGGGSETPPSNERDDGTPIGGVDGKYKYDRITIAGSSLTFGHGYLGFDSYLGEVEKYYRENVARTYNPQNADGIIDEPMSYKGKLYRYNSGQVISGSLSSDISSDEISMVYAVEQGYGNATLNIQIDGKDLGAYTINGNNIIPAIKVPNSSDYRFRETNPKSVKSWKVDKSKNHTFKFTVTNGTLLLDFVTNHMYYFQNAGIGGYSASDFLKSGTGTTTTEIRNFNPDLFIFESGTNDAQKWSDEDNPQKQRIQPSTNEWIVKNPVNFTPDANKITLSQNVSVKEGDVVVMGDYMGDIRTLAVGIVKEDSNTNVVTLTTNVPNGITNICRIKSIKTWEDNVKEVVRRVTEGRSYVKVGIGTSGVPNYYSPNEAGGSEEFSRRLMGYREKGKVLASKNSWMFFDFFGKILADNPYVDDGTQTSPWSGGDNTHPIRQKGRELFGQAIIDVLPQ